MHARKTPAMFLAMPPSLLRNLIRIIFAFQHVSSALVGIVFGFPAISIESRRVVLRVGARLVCLVLGWAVRGGPAGGSGSGGGARARAGTWGARVAGRVGLCGAFRGACGCACSCCFGVGCPATGRAGQGRIGCVWAFPLMCGLLCVDSYVDSMCGNQWALLLASMCMCLRDC